MLPRRNVVGTVCLAHNTNSFEGSLREEGVSPIISASWCHSERTSNFFFDDSLRNISFNERKPFVGIENYIFARDKFCPKWAERKNPLEASVRSATLVPHRDSILPLEK